MSISSLPRSALGSSGGPPYVPPVIPRYERRVLKEDERTQEKASIQYYRLIFLKYPLIYRYDYPLTINRPSFLAFSPDGSGSLKRKTKRDFDI